MRKDIKLGIIIALILVGFYYFFKVTGFTSGLYIFLFIVLAIWIFGFVNTIRKRKEVRTITKTKQLCGVNNPWCSLISSWLYPGLGQAIFAKQWKKLILFPIIHGGLWSGVYMLHLGLVNLSLIPFTISWGFQIYNLIDAYKIGEKYKKGTKNKIKSLRVHKF